MSENGDAGEVAQSVEIQILNNGRMQINGPNLPLEFVEAILLRATAYIQRTLTIQGTLQAQAAQAQQAAVRRLIEKP